MSIEDNIAKLTTAIEQLTVALVKHSAITEDAVKADNRTEVLTFAVPAPESEKAEKNEPVPAPAPTPEPTPEPTPTPAPISEDDLRVQIVELARPQMGDAAFKAFLGGKLAELQGAPCSISGVGKLPKLDAKHLPALLAALTEKLAK